MALPAAALVSSFMLAIALLLCTWQGAQGQRSSDVQFAMLDVPGMFPIRRGYWGMAPLGFGKNNISPQRVDDCDVLQVFYPQGSYKPSAKPQGGVQFVAAPQPVFPADWVKLSYSVKFADNFEWVIGGKLPGLNIGGAGASGGKKGPRKASFRVMWGGDGSATAYIYVPDGFDQVDAYFQQEGYGRSNGYGDGLWGNVMQFYKGQWNTVTVEVKLNSVVNGQPIPDGKIRLKVNGVERSFNQIVWRGFEDLKVHSVIFESFFGGNSPDWATPVDTMTYFKDIVVWNMDQWA